LVDQPPLGFVDARVDASRVGRVHAVIDIRGEGGAGGGKRGRHIS
jgi:hypothetical protein